MERGERQRFLMRAIEQRVPVPAELIAEPEIRNVFDTFDTPPGARWRSATYSRRSRRFSDIPAASLGAYVISMAEAPSDVLAVEYLPARVRIRPSRGPAFRGSGTLERAGETIRELLTIHPVPSLEVMIGYSDSAKDGGRLAANWISTKRRKTSSRRRATPACR